MRWWWKGILVLILMVVIIHGGATLIMARKLDRAIAAIKAQGAPVSPAELAGPSIPDSENGELEYLRAFEILRTNAAKLYQKIHAESRNAKPAMTFVRPAPGPTDTQRYVYLESMRFDELDDGAWGIARSLVDADSPAVRLIEQAQTKTRCRFYANWQDGVGAQFPYVAQVREAARRLGIRAVLHARDGRMDDAAHDLEMSVCLVDSMKDDRMLFHQLMRYSLVTTVSKSLQAVNQQHPLNAAQCLRLSSLLSGIEFDESFLRAMKGQRAMDLSAFSLVTKTPSLAGQMMGASEGAALPFAARLVSSYAWRPFLYADELASIRLQDSQILTASQPYREIRRSGQDRMLGDQVTRLPRYCLVTRMCMPGFAGIIAQRDVAKATVYGCDICLGLMACRDKFGAYPRSLDELRSKLRWNVREDPLSGRPFVYRREGGGFLLYSIGLNLRDDKGVRDPRTLGLGDSALDDIVWRDPARG